MEKIDTKKLQGEIDKIKEKKDRFYNVILPKVGERIRENIKRMGSKMKQFCESHNIDLPRLENPELHETIDSMRFKNLKGNIIYYPAIINGELHLVYTDGKNSIELKAEEVLIDDLIRIAPKIKQFFEDYVHPELIKKAYEMALIDYKTLEQYATQCEKALEVYNTLAEELEKLLRDLTSKIKLKKIEDISARYKESNKNSQGKR